MVTIRPKWRDSPEDNHVYRIEEWNGDRGFIVPVNLPGFKILPRSLVRSEMIECTLQLDYVKPVAIKSLEVLPDPPAVPLSHAERIGLRQRQLPKLVVTHYLKLVEPETSKAAPYLTSWSKKPVHAASSDALSDPCNKCGLWIKFWVNTRLIERPPQSEVYFLEGCYYNVLTSEELDWQNNWFISNNMVVLKVAKVTDENHIALIDAAVKNDPHAWER